MRLIGNKTHGDLAEIAIAEFINQYMYDFRSVHVGKDLYRAKSREEDINIINEITEREFPVSLKAYGDGPLQLSTDKNFRMFPRLEQEGPEVLDQSAVHRILEGPEFAEFHNVNILPLIYDEKISAAIYLSLITIEQWTKPLGLSRRRLEEVGGIQYTVFYDQDSGYVCEVRYGDAAANALQRGLWTHTKRGLKYFESITGGWIDYSHNPTLVKLFSHALVSSEAGHKLALKEIEDDITRLRETEGLKT